MRADEALEYAEDPRTEALVGDIFTADDLGCMQALAAEVRRLRSINAELVEALEAMIENSSRVGAISGAHKALARAKEKP